MVITQTMKIFCPALKTEEEATLPNISEIVPRLENVKDPFVILEKDDLTYMQALWTPDGYDLEYQDGSVFKHYRLSELVAQDDVIWALQSYLKDEPYWKMKFKFEKKEIATLSQRFGYKIGYFLGTLSRLFSGN